jgi:YfiH family protein
VSLAPFDSLNLSFRVGDREIHVRENREILARTLGFSPRSLVNVNQSHGDSILVIESGPLEDLSDAPYDAIVTDRRGTAIAVLTADCVPSLLFDPDHGVVAAIHAGWKGTASNIVGKTVQRMVERFDTEPEHLTAAVGPGIGPCCYEVDGQVSAGFSHHNDSWQAWAKRISRSHWMLDLPQANIDSLLASGLSMENMTLLTICTCCHGGLFYSHRREGGNTGRQIAFIMLK